MEDLANATRPVLWNISGIGFMYLLMGLSLGIFGYGLYRRIHHWKEGKSDRERLSDWGRRFRILLRELAFQKGTRGSRFPGLFHSLIFYSFFALFVTTAVIALDYDLGIPLFRGYLYVVLTMAAELAGVLILVGTGMAAWRRFWVKPETLSTDFRDIWPLLLIALVTLTGFFLEGIRIAATGDPWAGLSPVGYGLSLLFNGMTPRAAARSHQVLWWAHAVLAFGWIALLPFGKFVHLLSLPTNVFFSKLKPKGELQRLPIADSEGADGSEEEDLYLGIQSARDFTWKHRLDFDSCISCGRCETVCSARLSGHPFSPKEFILGCRNHTRSSGRDPEVFRSRTAVGEASETPHPPLVADQFDDPFFWACRTCMACMEVCPARIDHVDTLVEIRRYLVQGESRFPKELTPVFKGWKNMSNPWTLAANTRADWFKGLDVSSPSENRDFEYLYYAGCAGSFDDRNKSVSKALVRLMKKARVSFACLGNKEKCCGEMARRLGNEFLAQAMIESNVQQWNALGVKRIVTACPHCYNALKNEYGSFGGHYEVIHHTELIQRLVQEGRLEPAGSGIDPSMVVFHDSCYLGRGNGLYEPPREVIRSIPGVRLVEPESSGRLSFCCGAGGGAMWMESMTDQRISAIRFDQLMKTGAKTVATACPYCLIMLDDEIKIRNRSEEIQVRDIAQLWVHAMSE